MNHTENKLLYLVILVVIVSTIIVLYLLHSASEGDRIDGGEESKDNSSKMDVRRHKEVGPVSTKERVFRSSTNDAAVCINKRKDLDALIADLDTIDLDREDLLQRISRTICCRKFFFMSNDTV